MKIQHLCWSNGWSLSCHGEIESRCGLIKLCRKPPNYKSLPPHSSVDTCMNRSLPVYSPIPLSITFQRRWCNKQTATIWLMFRKVKPIIGNIFFHPIALKNLKLPRVYFTLHHRIYRIRVQFTTGSAGGSFRLPRRGGRYMINLGLFCHCRKPLKAHYNQLGFVTVQAPSNLPSRSRAVQPLWICIDDDCMIYAWASWHLKTIPPKRSPWDFEIRAFVTVLKIFFFLGTRLHFSRGRF